MTDSVRCADCGFLGVRFMETRQIMEAEGPFMQDGTIPRTTANGPFLAFEEHPVCFALAIDFRNATEMGMTEVGRDTRNEALHKQRECSKFTPWRHGYTPREHLEMMQLEEQRAAAQRREDADRSWRQDQSNTDRAWREEQAAKDQAWRESQATEDKAWRKQESIDAAGRHRNELMVLGVFAIVATCLSTLAAGCIERGYWWTKPEADENVVRVVVKPPAQAADKPQPQGAANTKP